MSNTIHQHNIDQYLPWFILKNVPGVGNILYRRLIQRFGSPENVLIASRYDLMTIKGMGDRVLFAITNPAMKNSGVIDVLKDEIRQIEKAGFKIITMIEENYPALLKQIPDPPPYLTYIGSLDTTDNELPSLAIVGSRQATSYGLNTAENLAYDLVLNGFQIVSGMAIGIDSAAHNGALRASGRTVAVLGSGLSKIYPSENRSLFYKIADNGAVISEFKIGSEPEGRHFPIRNRIIAGMSLGTVVVEAAEKSGSLITARLAVEYNREVFAVPGDIHSLKSSGTHALLKQGAKLVENYMDVTEELYNIEPLKFSNQFSANQVNANQISAAKSKLKCKLRNENGSKLQDQSKLESQSLFNDNSKSIFKKNKEQSSCEHKHSSFENKRTPFENKRTPFENKRTSLTPFEPDKYQSAILNIIKSSPIHIDAIIEQSALDTAGITAGLMDLELMGIVKHSPGKMFYKVEEES